MSLVFASLNSGSNGNCYYVGNEKDAVLIDAGISCRETEKRMTRLGLTISRVRAIVVSHEHTDHIKGIPMIAKKHRIPVYITSNTYRNASFRVDDTLIRHFSASQSLEIGSLSVATFSKFHDAADPCSFVVTSGELKVGVFTDIGAPCENLIEHFQQCHAALLEANYDEEMLENGSYPYFLKNRIRGGSGHLSNTQALHVFCRYRPVQMSHLILTHLSKNNNCPQLVHRLFQENASGTEVVVASRFEETALFEINPGKEVLTPSSSDTQYALF